MNADVFLTQQEAMERLRLTRYMIRKLEREEGMPRTDEGYPWPAIRDWYDEWDAAAEPTSLLSQTETAERLGLSARQIRRLSDAGIPREAGGYPWPAVRDWYTAFKQQEAVDRHLGGTEDRQKWLAARARKEAANAELYEIDVEEQRRSVLHVEDLSQLVGEPLRRLQKAVEGLPARLAKRLCPSGQLAPTSHNEIAIVLRDEVDSFLEALSAESPFEIL